MTLFVKLYRLIILTGVWNAYKVKIALQHTKSCKHRESSPVAMKRTVKLYRFGLLGSILH